MATQNHIIAVVGMRDMGKTTYLRKLLADEPRILIVDSLGDHGFGSKGIPAWCETPKSKELPEILQEIEAHKDEPWRLAVPMPPDDEDKEVWFDFLCNEAWQTGREHGILTLVVEEMGYYTQAGWTPPGLNTIIQYGAHAPVNLIWTSRNPGEVTRRLTSETNLYVLFRVQEPRWVEALEDRLTEEVAERVPQLEPGEYIMVNDRGEIEQEAKLW